MANAKHLARLEQGVAAWNAWRRRSPTVNPDLSRAFLIEAELRGINLSNTNLERANLRMSTLSRANLTRAVLRFTSQVDADIEGALLTGCEIYGTSAWNLRGTPRDQSNLVIRANREEPAVTVDDLEVAQFIYLLLHNNKIRNVIETVGKKAVLILGRFTAERKAVLDAVRDLLRLHGYVSILFDFPASKARDLTETVVTLAHMSRFIIADLTDPLAVPQELTAIIPHLPSVPVLPVILRSARLSPIFEHWWRYPWVLPLVKYKDQPHLMQRLEGSLIARAERKAQQRTGI